jgi:hypothetical protein
MASFLSNQAGYAKLPTHPGTGFIITTSKLRNRDQQYPSCRV